jgi:hypothetical protein
MPVSLGDGAESGGSGWFVPSGGLGGLGGPLQMPQHSLYPGVHVDQDQRQHDRCRRHPPISSACDHTTGPDRPDRPPTTADEPPTWAVLLGGLAALAAVVQWSW